MYGLSLGIMFLTLIKDRRMMTARTEQSLSIRHSGMKIPNGMTGKGFQKPKRQKKLTQMERVQQSHNTEILPRTTMRGAGDDDEWDWG